MSVATSDVFRFTIKRQPELRSGADSDTLDLNEQDGDTPIPLIRSLRTARLEEGGLETLRRIVTDFLESSNRNESDLSIGLTDLSDTFSGIQALLESCLLYTSPSPRDS